MTREKKSDRFEILTAIIAYKISLETEISKNPLYSTKYKCKLIQLNSNIFQGVVDRYLGE